MVQRINVQHYNGIEWLSLLLIWIDRNIIDYWGLLFLVSLHANDKTISTTHYQTTNKRLQYIWYRLSWSKILWLKKYSIMIYYFIIFFCGVANNSVSLWYALLPTSDAIANNTPKLEGDVISHIISIIIFWYHSIKYFHKNFISIEIDHNWQIHCANELITILIRTQLHFQI